jgi:hypothetical protein
LTKAQPLACEADQTLLLVLRLQLLSKLLGAPKPVVKLAFSGVTMHPLDIALFQQVTVVLAQKLALPKPNSSASLIVRLLSPGEFRES